MTGKHPSRSYLKPAAVSSTTLGHSYHFTPMGNSENDLSEEDPEEYALRPRGREKTRRSTSKERLDDIILISKDIAEGDTLNSIALQHCCTEHYAEKIIWSKVRTLYICSKEELSKGSLRIFSVRKDPFSLGLQNQATLKSYNFDTTLVADLKRANSLINEQDFFALRTIKIPVKRFSLLADPQFSPKVKQSRTLPGQPSEEQQYSVLLEAPPLETADSFLQEVDRDIKHIVRSTDVTKENLHEVVSALSHDLHFEPDFKAAKPKDPYYGADWGLGWWTAVVIMVIVGVVTPVFYFLYYEVLDREPHLNSSNATNPSEVDSSPGND